MFFSLKRPAAACEGLDSNIKRKYPRISTETADMDVVESSNLLADSLAKLHYSGSRSAFSIFKQKSNPVEIQCVSSDHRKLNQPTSKA